MNKIVCAIVYLFFAFSFKQTISMERGSEKKPFDEAVVGIRVSVNDGCCCGSNGVFFSEILFFSKAKLLKRSQVLSDMLSKHYDPKSKVNFYEVDARSIMTERDWKLIKPVLMGIHGIDVKNDEEIQRVRNLIKILKISQQ